MEVDEIGSRGPPRSPHRLVLRLVRARDHRDRDGAPGRQPVHVARDDGLPRRRRPVVQDRAEREENRLPEVDQAPEIRVPGDFPGPRQVRQHHPGPGDALLVELGLVPVLPGDVGIGVHAPDRRLPAGVEDGLQDAAFRRVAAAQVEELPDLQPRDGQQHGVLEPHPVGGGDPAQIGADPQQLGGQGPVGRVVVLLPQRRAVDAGARRPVGAVPRCGSHVRGTSWRCWPPGPTYVPGRAGRNGPGGHGGDMARPLFARRDPGAAAGRSAAAAPPSPRRALRPAGSPLPARPSSRRRRA